MELPAAARPTTRETNPTSPLERTRVNCFCNARCAMAANAAGAANVSAAKTDALSGEVTRSEAHFTSAP